MQLENIIYEYEDDFKISKIIKEHIKNYLENIKIEGGKDFFVKHTKQMDNFISLIYKYLIKKSFYNYAPPLNSIPITIIALGSYGREQLSIYSDIDIMLVYKDIKGYNLKEIIENFITMLWDLGLKIGHRVHKIDELFDISNTDITIKTAILESRFIIGSKFLWYETQNELNKIRNYNKKEFILAKYNEMKQRHKKYPLSMEPNIKDGFGGIRDANTLFWIQKVIFNYPNTSYLIPKFTNEEEFRKYRSNLEFLFKVRVYLHQIAKRKVDKVYLQYQREIALKLGFKDSPRLKAERKFIKELLKALWTINTFTETTIKQIIKPFLFNSLSIKKYRKEKNIFICNETIYSNFKTDFTFKELLQKLLKYDYNKVDESVIFNLKNKKSVLNKTIKKQLFYKENLYPLLFALYRANKLEKIIPPFEKIKHLAQFDGYHEYPVDIHLIKTIKEVENLKEFQSLSQTDRAILRFALLFHDIGKGRKEDHSIIGAKIAKEFANKISFPDSNTIAKLIKYHTLMSNIAQREDIYNDKVILSFSEVVENRRFLNLLYILTIADIKAVGNNVFTPFKESLLKTLYNNTLFALNNKNLINEISIRKRKEKILIKRNNFKTLPKYFQKKVLLSPSNQLFLQNSISNIIDIITWIKDTSQFKYRFSNEKNLIIEIAKDDSLNFSIGWFLEQLYLNLNRISIYKIGNIKYFKIEFEDKIENFDLNEIEQLIKKAFEEKLHIKNKIKFKKSEFQIDCNHSQNYASLKLKTEDKKGIISTIMQILDDFNIRVEDVKITKTKNIIRDLFIISKENSFCKKVDTILKRLIK